MPESGAMVEVPVGDFIYQDGKAVIEEPYLIDVYPVTIQQYEKFIDGDGYKNNDYWSGPRQIWLRTEGLTEPQLWTDERFNQPDHPVVGVSYYEAEAYAKWAGKRLPTEKEWERAARGTDGREYPWGDQFDQERCNTAESSHGMTTPVTRYPNDVSPVGCYDLAGNVWEWTASRSEVGEQLWVLRGGSWDDNQSFARCTNRNWFFPGDGDGYCSFRCAKDI